VTYSDEVLADSPIGYYHLDDALISVLATSASDTYGPEPTSAAIDGNPGTWWTSGGAPLPHWWQVQFNAPITVIGYSIARRPDIPGRNPVDFTLSGSNDGSTWALLDTKTGVSWPAGHIETSSFSNSIAYQHYRVDVTANGGDAYTSIAEITFDTIEGFGNAGILSTTASSYYGAGLEPDKAFDANYGTQWHSTSDMPCWIKAHLKTATAVHTCSITILDYSTNRSPRDFTIEGSNDDSTWTVLDTVTGSGGWAPNETRVFPFSNSTVYLYYQLVITASNGDNYMNIRSINLGGLSTANHLLDSSTVAVNGVPAGAATLQDPAFTGSEHSLRISTTGTATFPGAVLNTSKASIELWIKTTATTGTLAESRIPNSADGLDLFISNGGDWLGGKTGAIGFKLGTDNVYTATWSDAVVNDGLWHHIVGVFDGEAGVVINPATHFKIYVDGVEDSPHTANYASHAAPVHTAPSGYVLGGMSALIDELAFYPTALSAERVAAHFAASASLPLGSVTHPLVLGSSSSTTAAEVPLAGPPSPSAYEYVTQNVGFVAPLTKDVWEYVYSNAGFKVVLSAEAREYVYSNAGFKVVLSAEAREYVYENAGFQIILKSDVREYVYESEVDTSVPVPHVWFTYQPQGSAGDKVKLYGYGLGHVIDQYGADTWVDYGPVFTTDNVAAGVDDWEDVAPGPDAYTAVRRIWPGSLTVPPVVTMSVEVITIIMPTAIAPTPDQGAQHDLVYVIHSGGTSNRVPWLCYPSIPVKMAMPPTAISTNGGLRVGADPPGVFSIPQPWTLIVPEPYIIAGGRAERRPLMGAISKTVAHAKSYSTTENLDEALDVQIAGWRWLPDQARIAAHPERGTGVSLWWPSTGGLEVVPGTSIPMAWSMYADTAGYVDPQYVLESRQGDLIRPAFVLPGETSNSSGARVPGAWLELTPTIATGPAFTLAFAAVLHPGVNGRTGLVASFVPGGEAVGKQALKMSLTFNVLTTMIGGVMNRTVLRTIAGRAVIVVISIGATPLIVKGKNQGNGRILILDHGTTQQRSFTHPPMTAAGQKLYLGREADMGSVDTTAHMDLLEIVLRYSASSSAQMWDLANRMDSIYGVVK
jgi:hypothetical protein